MSVSAAASAAAALAVFTSGAVAAEGATPRYASIVIDPAAGKVHHARRADYPLATPALRRVLGLYAALATIERGEASLEGSPQADALADAIYALASGRGDLDAATTVIARELAGGEAAWTARLVETALALDLRHTDVATEVTTARDLAKLTAALLGDFPQSSRVAATGPAGRNAAIAAAWTAEAAAVTDGFDGALFVTAADERLIAVVLGAEAASARDVHGAELLALAAGVTDAPVRLTPPLLPTAPRREVPSQLRRDAPPAPVLVAAASSHAGGTATVSPAAAPASAARFTPRAEWGDASEPGWRVQTGAFSSVEAAHAHSAAVIAAAPDALTAARLSVEAVEIEGGLVFRARFAGFDRAGAYSVCDALAATDASCFVVEPSVR